VVVLKENFSALRLTRCHRPTQSFSHNCLTFLGASSLAYEGFPCHEGGIPTGREIQNGEHPLNTTVMIIPSNPLLTLEGRFITLPILSAIFKT
jgi:hypothetical protein